MSVEVVHDQMNYACIRIHLIYQPAHELGEVGVGAMVCDFCKQSRSLVGRIISEGGGDLSCR